MRGHMGVAVVQEYGCASLQNLGFDAIENKGIIVSEGGIEAVVAAMRAHPGAEKVQDFGCLALRLLADDHPANQTAVRRAGAIKLAQAVCAHFASENVAHKEARTLLTSLKPWRRCFGY